MNKMIKISRMARARRAGVLNDLLIRAGLRQPPPRTNPLALGAAGAAAAGGLGLAGLSAAYPDEAAQIIQNMEDQAGSYIGSIDQGLTNLAQRNPISKGLSDRAHEDELDRISRDEAYFGHKTGPEYGPDGGILPPRYDASGSLIGGEGLPIVGPRESRWGR